nr:hypothetical protein [Tanacetum cinerariifolium]
MALMVEFMARSGGDVDSMIVCVSPGVLGVFIAILPLEEQGERFCKNEVEGLENMALMVEFMARSGGDGMMVL